MAKSAPFKIQTVLTDNGKEFTDRLFGKHAKEASGAHEFDALCEALGIDHRLTQPPALAGALKGLQVGCAGALACGPS